MMKRISALGLVLVMVLSLCACGKKDKTPEEIIQETSQKMESMKSYTMQMDMDFGMSVNGMSIPMTMTSTSEVLVKPMKVHTNMEMNMSMMGAMKMEMYVEESGDKATTYMRMQTPDGNQSPWQKQQGASTQNMAIDSTKTMKLLTNLTIAEEKEEVNGVKALRINGELTGKNMVELFKTMSSSMGGAESLGLQGDNMDEMLKALDGTSIKLSYFVNEEDMTLVSAMIDLKDMISKIPDGPEGLNVDKMVMTMGFSDFDKIDKLDIPQEVLDAVAVQ